MFGFSLWAESATSDTLIVEPPSQQRERSYSETFFSFFSEGDGYEEGSDMRNSASPVHKTLSEMAQTLSDMADETIRTFSPAPVPEAPPKISYRRKTVCMPGGLPTSSLAQLHAASVSEEPAHQGLEPLLTLTAAAAEPTPDELTIPDNFPSYRPSTKDKETPLLTSFSRGRPSFHVRDSAINKIAARTKTELEDKNETPQVRNFSGMKQLSSINELSQEDCTTTAGFSVSEDFTMGALAEVPEEHFHQAPEPMIRYDSEDYLFGFGDCASLMIDDDEDDVITTDYDYAIFKPVPAICVAPEALFRTGSMTSLTDEGPTDLLGTAAWCDEGPSGASPILGVNLHVNILV